MNNDTFRDYVTSVGFSLTLTQTQIYILVILHYAKGYENLRQTGLIGPRTYGSRYYVPAYLALKRRGLVETQVREKALNNHVLTKAGHLTVALLKEAGIYQATLLKAGVTQ